ncbi:hypothetical protein [Haloarcula nitratireducens]|uniref:C2H2-type domain-containing protein n=1 Tax=Haloarcula nitratireducens TaxID=2487749 RepID=A0AAW4PFP1_9EURY|nr:hypothetical protein [Halomicroarcula nitratireducens]MBX0296381.1 hypothetical protein [Halomicroarcula nitratireducens]
MSDPPHQFDVDRGEQGRTDVDYRFDCEFCEAVLWSATEEGIKLHGASHLTDHRREISDAVDGRTWRIRCENDCGNVLAVVDSGATGFECSGCGQDNFEAVASRYLYWQIERL